MTFRSTTLTAATVLALLLGGTAAVAKPARKPVAAAKALKPSPRVITVPGPEPYSVEPHDPPIDAPGAEQVGEAKPPRKKPATAAAPAKSTKPSPKFSETFPEAAAAPEAEAAAAAIEGAEPPADTAAAPAGEAASAESAPPAEASAGSVGAAETATEAAEPPAEAPPPTEGAAASDTAPPSEAAESPASDAAPPVAAPDPAPSDAPAAEEAAAAPKKGDPPTREFMVGVWAEPGKSCETALDFKADGTLIGPFPRWELSPEGELTMVGNRQKIMLKVLDKDTLQSRRSETDPPRTLKRC